MEGHETPEFHSPSFASGARGPFRSLSFASESEKPIIFLLVSMQSEITMSISLASSA
jgi:hypothetical protein